MDIYGKYVLGQTQTYFSPSCQAKVKMSSEELTGTDRKRAIFFNSDNAFFQKERHRYEGHMKAS